MALPLIFPFALPIEIDAKVQSLYDFIETLGPDDVVLIAADHSPAYKTAVHGAVEAIFAHAISRGCKVIFCSFAPDGPMLVEEAIKSAEFLEGKVYGVDYVHLGYRSGGEGAVAAVLEDFHANFPVDFHGSRVEDLEIMDHVQSAKDISLAVLVTVGGYAGGGWVRQLVLPYGKPLAVVCTGMMGPSHVPYYDAKQLVGLVVDQSGSAMYETLVNRPGIGLAGMGAQTLTLMTVLIFMVLSNVVYFVRRQHSEGGKERK